MLTALNLTNNYIGNEGVIALADALRNCVVSCTLPRGVLQLKSRYLT